MILLKRGSTTIHLWALMLPHVLIFTAIGRNTNIPKIIHVFTVFIVDINKISIGIK